MSDHDQGNDHAGDGARHPRLIELEAMVRDGRIDTIVVAITDMQGRLMASGSRARRSLTGSSATAPISAPTCWAPIWR